MFSRVLGERASLKYMSQNFFEIGAVSRSAQLDSCLRGISRLQRIYTASSGFNYGRDSSHSLEQPSQPRFESDAHSKNTHRFRDLVDPLLASKEDSSRNH